MATRFPSPTPPDRLQFSITGTIATWNAFGRWLGIGARDVWVQPGVTVAGLVPGATVTASGYLEAPSGRGRWVVTQLTL
jgi:hypothetical protein